MPFILSLPNTRLFGYHINKQAKEYQDVRVELWRQCEEKSELCDVTIKLAGEEELKSHWCVLVTCPYFKSLYESGLMEKHSAVLELKLVPADVAKLAVKFIYHSVRNNNIQVEESQTEELLKISDFLQLDELKTACDERLSSNDLKLENCLKMLQLAEMYNAKSLYEKSRSNLLSNFQNVAKGDDILGVTAEFLVSLMNDKALAHVAADDFYELVMRWIAVSSDRDEVLPELFACINLKDLSLPVWESISKKRSLLKNQSIKKLLENHKKLIKSGAFDPAAKDKEVILFAGGCNEFHGDTGCDACYAYVIEDDKWCEVQRLPRRLVGGLAVLSEDVYFCGTRVEVKSSDYCADIYKLRKSDPIHWDVVHGPSNNTDDVLCCTFSNDGKLVSVRAFNKDVFILVFDPKKMLLSTQNAKRFELFKLHPLTEHSESNFASMVHVKENIAIHIKVIKSGSVPYRHKFFIFNAKTGVVADYSFPGLNGEIMYSDGKKIHLETPGQKYSNVFDIQKRKWSKCRRGLPAFSEVGSWIEYSVVSHNDDLYAYGTNIMEKGRRQPAAFCKLSRGAHKWLPLAPPPLSGHPESHVASAIVKLPKENVRCSLKDNCQKCRDHLARFYSDDDSDNQEEEDSSFYGDSDSYDPPFFFGW